MAKRFEVVLSRTLLQMLPETDADADAGRTEAAFIWLNDRLKSLGAPGIHVFVMSDGELALKTLRHLRQIG